MVSGLHGHPIAAQLEDWFLRHAGDHEDPEWEAFIRDFKESLDGKVGELLREHDNEGRFGMSKSGGCTRAQALKKLGFEGEPFSGSTHFTFLLGHVVEVMSIAALRRVGYKVNGLQEPVRIDPFMSSFSDGIIEGVEGTKGRPAILSVKSTGYKKSGKERSGKWTRRGFPELPFEGVRKAQPGWYAQVQAEMHGSGLKWAFIQVTAKDIIKAMEGDPYLGPEGNGSLTFYGELVAYNPRFVEEHLLPVWDNQWQNVQAGKAGPAYYLHNERDEYVRLTPGSTDWQPNAGLTGTYNPCNYCDLVGACRSQLASRFHN